MHPLASEVIKGCIPRGQRKPFPANCMSLMTVSGAKGSTVNFSQIACLLGQQVRAMGWACNGQHCDAASICLAGKIVA
jgi:DNA-directed RNA polymerase beta' subunit